MARAGRGPTLQSKWSVGTPSSTGRGLPNLTSIQRLMALGCTLCTQKKMARANTTPFPWELTDSLRKGDLAFRSLLSVGFESWLPAHSLPSSLEWQTAKHISDFVKKLSHQQTRWKICIHIYMCSWRIIIHSSFWQTTHIL